MAGRPFPAGTQDPASLSPDYFPLSTPVACPLLTSTAGGSDVNWFNLSLVGWVVLIIAVAVAAYLLGAPPVWIAVGALALIGVGIIASVKSSKPTDPRA